jgi:hypothetical protein
MALLLVILVPLVALVIHAVVFHLRRRRVVRRLLLHVNRTPSPWRVI